MAIAALVIVVTLARGRDEVLATNGIDPAVFVAEVDPGKRLCEPGPVSSPEAGAYAVVAGGFGSDVRVVLETVSGRRLAIGEAGGPGGLVSFPIDEDAAGVQRLCIRNRGADRVALAGERSATEERVAVYAIDKDPPSWLAKTPSALDAVGAARGAVFGPAGWFAIILAAGGAFLAIFWMAQRGCGAR